jgi:hypothetical protein
VHGCLWIIRARGGCGRRRHMMWVTARDEAEPTHKSLTIFRKLVEI